MKSNQPIRLAILGLDSGFFPENWTQWVQLGQLYPWFDPAFPKAEIVAAATLGRSEEEIAKNSNSGELTSAKFGEKFGIKIYQSGEELLDKEKPDGVFICGRPSALPAIARMAISRGVHIYVQKPAGVNAEELAAVAEEAKKRGIFASAGQTWRYDNAVVTSKEQLNVSNIGKLCSLRIMYNHAMPGADSWYFDEGEGGPELWLAWYPIDLLHHFTGSRIKRVFATGHSGDGSAGKENTIIHASCEFENGVNGSFDFYGNIKYPYSRAEWELLGENGLIRNIQRHDVEIYQLGKPQQAMYRNGYFDGVAQDIIAWLCSWTTGKTNGLTLEGAVEVVRVGAAVRQSIASGKAVTL